MDTALHEEARSQKLNLVTSTPQVLRWKSTIFHNESACPIRKSQISLNSIAINKLWLVYSTLSYFWSYILRVLRNGLVQRFSNPLYLLRFLYNYYFNSSSAGTIFIRLKLVWACLWHAWTGRYTRTSKLLSAPFSEKSFILIAPWNCATILFHFKNQFTVQNKKCFYRNIWNNG